MKLIDRYILISLIRPLLLCLLTFYCLFIIIDLLSTLPDIIKSGAGMGTLIQIYTVPAPFIFQVVTPAAFFLAVISVLVMWSDSRELTSLQSAGTGLARLSIPFFLISLLVMVIQYALFIQLSPKAGAIRKALEDKLEKRAGISNIFRKVVYKNPATGALWYVQEIDLDHETLKQAEVLMPDELGRDRVKLFVARGEYKNGYWDFAGIRKVEFNRDGSSLPPQDMTQMDARSLNESPRQLVAVMQPANGMTWPELQEFLRMPQLGSSAKIAPYQTENYYRFAYPFMCPVLCLFAFALAVNYDRRSKATTIFHCLLVLAGFMLVYELSKSMGNQKRISPWLASWGPILIFGTAGLYLFSERVGWMWNLRHFIRQGPSPAGRI